MGFLLYKVKSSDDYIYFAEILYCAWLNIVGFCTGPLFSFILELSADFCHTRFKTAYFKKYPKVDL